MNAGQNAGRGWTAFAMLLAGIAVGIGLAWSHFSGRLNPQRQPPRENNPA